jgi:hypothetical protein
LNLRNKKKPPFSLIFGLLVFYIYSCGAFAQAESSDDFLRIPYSESRNIYIDGKLEEPIWNSLPSIDRWYQLTPSEGESPSEKTEMRLFHDGNAIYIGARLYTENISTVMTRRLERDSFTPDEDAVAVILDTLNDNRTGFGFIVTAAGIRTDIAIFEDAEMGDNSWNLDWNAFWDASTYMSADGWSAEIRIPFSSLRFKSRSGQAEMGLILWRYIAHNVEFNIFPAIPNNWNLSAYKPSQAQSVEIEGIEEKHPLYIRPYVLGGLEQENILPPLETSYTLDSRRKSSLGLDLKYNLTSNHVLDATLNPDFAQVEADDERINLTRFSLFFPEKRPFFQERSDLFEIRIPVGGQKLFHSRTIGIREGRTVPIIGGIRFTGRTGNWHIGLLEMQTAQTKIDNERIPSENVGVLRVMREIKNDGSFLGGMLTSRTDFGGHYNIVAALDADVSLAAPHAYMKLRLAQSAQPGAPFKKSLIGAITLESRMRRGFSYAVVARHIGRDFFPGMGYLSRGNVNLLYNRLEYIWFPNTSSFIQNHGFQNKMTGIWNSETGQFETFDNTLLWAALFRSGAQVNANLKLMEENLFRSYFIGDMEIEPGHYRFSYAEANFLSSSGTPFQIGIKGTAGGYFSGRQWGSEQSISWTLSSHLTLSLDNIFSTAAIGDQKYRPHVARFRIDTALNRSLSVKALIQYSRDLKRMSSNLRLRFNPVEGVDLFIVYNEGIYTERSRMNPPLPLTEGRSILVKFNYTLVKD